MYSHLVDYFPEYDGKLHAQVYEKTLMTHN